MAGIAISMISTPGNNTLSDKILMEPIILRQLGMESRQEMVSLSQSHKDLWFVRVIGGSECWWEEGRR
jgi:hypothetical protein